MRTWAVRVLLVAALLCAALPARGQFVQLSRCRAALPCALPFGIRYNPDPLIAAQYGRVSTTAVSARLEPGWPIQTPVIDLSRVIESQDFAREAARLFVLRYPAPKTTPAPPAAPAGAPEPPRQP